MTLVIFIILFSGLGVAVYLFLLNPEEITIHLSSQYVVDISPVTLMLCSVAIGVFLIMLLSFCGSAALFFRERLAQVRARALRRSEELFTKGFHRYYNGNLAAAEKLFLSVLSYLPSHADALCLLGNIKSRKGEPLEAAFYHSRVREMDKKNIENLYALASDFEATGDMDQAVSVYNDIFELDKSSVNPYEMIREVYVRSGEWEKAIGFQRRIVSLIREKSKLERENDRISWLKYCLALENIDHGDSDEGVNILKSIVRLNVDFIPAYLKLAEMYFIREREKDGVQALENGYRHTESVVFILKLTEHYQAAGDDIAAVRSFRRGISVSKDPALLHLLLGEFFVRKGMAEEGVSELERARGKFNSKAFFHLILAKGYKALERYREGESEINLACAAGTRDIVLYACSFCQHKERVWMDTCPECGEFNAFVAAREPLAVKQLSGRVGEGL